MIHKRDRFKTYKRMLEWLKGLDEWSIRGFCAALHEVGYEGSACTHMGYCDRLEDYPELMEFKPINIPNHGRWFKTVQERINILEKILKIENKQS